MGFTSESWKAKDYGRTTFSATKAISVLVNTSGTLDVAPFVPSASSSSEFVIIPWVSKFRVYAIVSVIVTGAGTPDVTIRVSFQQNIQYLEFDPILGAYDIKWTARDTTPFFATAEAQLDPS